MENNIAVQKEFISNPGTIFEAKITMKASITNVNKPKVKMFIGRDRIIKIGFTNIFSKAKTNAAIKAMENDGIFTPVKR